MGKHGLKLIAFDMDGTITEVRSSWEYLHRRMGIWNRQAEKYQERFLAGEISYEEFCRLDAAMWRNMSLNQLMTIIKEIPIRRNAQKIIQISMKLGAQPVLLSTGLKILADIVAARLGFKYHLANELVHQAGILTGDCIVHVSTHEPGKTKGAHLKKIMARTGASSMETAAVGDSTGDMEMFLEAGLAIAVNPPAQEMAVLQSSVPHLVTVNSLGEAAVILEKHFGTPVDNPR